MKKTEYTCDLVRFHEWVIDRNEIECVSIESVDGEVYSDFEKKEHNIILTMKSSKRFILNCSDLYDAKKELNLFTCESKCKLLVDAEYLHFFTREIHRLMRMIEGLDSSVKKIMNSYKKSKEAKR